MHAPHEISSAIVQYFFRPFSRCSSHSRWAHRPARSVWFKRKGPCCNERHWLVSLKANADENRITLLSRCSFCVAHGENESLISFRLSPSAVRPHSCVCSISSMARIEEKRRREREPGTCTTSARTALFPSAQTHIAHTGKQELVARKVIYLRAFTLRFLLLSAKTRLYSLRWENDAMLFREKSSQRRTDYASERHEKERSANAMKTARDNTASDDDNERA